MSEGEGVERDGGERDNMTFAVAERHVTDGVLYSRFCSLFSFFTFTLFPPLGPYIVVTVGDLPSDSGALNCRHGRGLVIGLWDLKLSLR
jgi:hypothetical protein